ncbi:D-glycero-beta-D-manno-heptose 1,7-bisphosphate 7-phosphatase [Gimesia sp.]|uniref:D-glycero-beta-D-manno-heptose 1,7-bisphosphate 7-phosphatase n=1 Tax=Gimesia sp. TaxID=2024833 RepID=UPI003A8E5134
MQVTSSRKKSLFLDRDGVINVEKEYLHRIQDFEFIDGIFELCQAAQDAGYALFIVTNQSGIARGYYTERQFQKLMTWVLAEFSRHNVTIADYFYCPHHPTKGTGHYRIACQCRKPKPQMLLDAAQKYDLDLSQSIMVGDKRTDIQAGQAAHVGTSALVGTGHAVSLEDQLAADVYADTLTELTSLLFPATPVSL